MNEEEAIYVTAEEKMRAALEVAKAYMEQELCVVSNAPIILQIDDALMKPFECEDLEKRIDRAFQAGYKQRDTEYGLKARHVQELISSAYKEGKTDRNNETAIQLIELPASIKSQSSVIATLIADIEKLRLSIALSKNQTWELVLCATVTEMGKTKEKFTNEKTRNMAVEKLLREDKLYLDNCDEIGRKECALKKEQIQLDYLQNLFRANLAIAGIKGVE